MPELFIQNIINIGIPTGRDNNCARNNNSDSITTSDIDQIQSNNMNNNDNNLRQKRHGSNSYYYSNTGNNKRRIGKPSTLFNESNLENNTILRNQKTPSKTTGSRRPSLSKKIMAVTPQPSYVVSEPNQSPFYIPNNSYSNLEPLGAKFSTSASYTNTKPSNAVSPKIIKGNDYNIVDRKSSLSPQGIGKNEFNPIHSRINNNISLINDNSDNNSDIHNVQKSTFIDNSERQQTDPRINELSNNEASINNNSLLNNNHENNTNNDLNNESTFNMQNPDSNNNQIQNSTNDNNQKNNQNGNNNNNNNNGNNGSNSKKTSLALVQKLQEIYKYIVKLEIELQGRCSQLTTSQTTELKNLWSIYKINIDLINNYITFITTALLPSQSPQDILIGEEIVEIYRIERRLWVYGTITFLDVLKNFSNFMDPEVCSQFITHVFISLSTMLIDIPPKHSIPWLQRLGDLSRMAIALYPSGFIDWKLSAEHWYTEAMKYTYGHGKLYYHISTVQQNTLEAFVNLGKSVFCQDTFTPSQQYMQLVIDNIYQRTFVDRTSSGSYRNSDLIDYLKHSEVMLLPSFLGSNDLQQVVLNYFQDRFGIDFNDKDIFNTRAMFAQPPNSLRFFFRHAPAFAESHILQLVGFGNPKNPFALLFDLPKFLKERKDKKEKNKSKSSSVTEMSIADETEKIFSTDAEKDVFISEYFDNLVSLKSTIEKPDLAIWLKSVEHFNMTSLKCSMIVLRKFLHSPLLVALPHLLPWTYFIIATLKKVNSLGDEQIIEFWKLMLKRIFPWDTITSFLNVLIAYTLDNYNEAPVIDELCQKYSSMGFDQLLEYFNDMEDLPEVWKCWGTLWFDVISNKSAINSDDYKGFGIDDHMFLDFPLDGIGFDQFDETGEKFWRRSIRVIFLYVGIAEECGINLKISKDSKISCRRNDLRDDIPLRHFSFKLEPYNNFTSDHISLPFELFEEASTENCDFFATPSLSVIKGESIFDYPGYKRLSSDNNSFDKNGEFISSSIYTNWTLDSVNVNKLPQETQLQAPQQFPNPQLLNDNVQTSGMSSSETAVVSTIPQDEDEEWLFKMYTNPDTSVIVKNNNGKDVQVNQLWIDSSNEIDKNITYFVFDATSWLRHFAHIYKLSTNSVLKFAVCLTTFQELRFLRKSKDENVVEAAARAIITMRQLYSEGKLLPLRFTGNVATDIEEHLEFEEQITWRSHVDEFVIEAVMKAQQKFASLSDMENGNNNSRKFNYVVLVTDDINMKKKAQVKDIKTFSTHFIFSICTKLGTDFNVCTN